jgi:hypothetical protein
MDRFFRGFRGGGKEGCAAPLRNLVKHDAPNARCFTDTTHHPAKIDLIWKNDRKRVAGAAFDQTHNAALAFEYGGTLIVV